MTLQSRVQKRRHQNGSCLDGSKITQWEVLSDSRGEGGWREVTVGLTVGDGGCGKRKRGCVGSGDVGVEGGDGFVKQL